jgi:hypothetical protein
MPTKKPASTAAKKLRYRRRINASPPPGLRQAWDEYQVWQGRKIIGRYDFREQALRDHPDAVEATNAAH